MTLPLKKLLIKSKYNHVKNFWFFINLIEIFEACMLSWNMWRSLRWKHEQTKSLQLDFVISTKKWNYKIFILYISFKCFHMYMTLNKNLHWIIAYLCIIELSILFSISLVFCPHIEWSKRCLYQQNKLLLIDGSEVFDISKGNF